MCFVCIDSAFNKHYNRFDPCDACHGSGYFPTATVKPVNFCKACFGTGSKRIRDLRSELIEIRNSVETIV